VDSDCIVSADWLEKMVDSHLKVPYAAIVGGIGNGTPANLVGWTGYLIEFNEWTPKTKPRMIECILGGNVSFKKEIILKHNLAFRGIFHSEDTVFAWDLRSVNEDIFFDPSIVVYHLNRTNLSMLVRHQYILGKSSVQARRSTGLYGQIFVRYPVLCVALPFIRFFRASTRLAKQDLGYFFIFLIVMPLYFLCNISWMLGFMSKSSDTDSRIGYNYQIRKDS
jgi:hypothetical protein